MTTAILDTRPAARLGTASPQVATRDLVRLLALDGVPRDRRVVCRWRRNADGLLAASWEPDIASVPPL